MKLVFSSVFESDFSAAVEFLARESGAAIATRWENSVCRTIESLQKQPQLGRLRRDLQPEIRTFGVINFPRFLIFYTIKNNDLVLLRLKHGAMNLQALFSGS